MTSNVQFGSGIQDRCRMNLGSGECRVVNYSKRGQSRQNTLQHFDAFGIEVRRNALYSCSIAAGSLELLIESAADAVVTQEHDDRNGFGRPLRRSPARTGDGRN